MQNSLPKARRGMVTFVITIFLIAIVIAGIYLLGFTPGEA
jgi:heme/copper-type cytochrome/quinol oxidase subunit 4